ncbi:protein kinase [Alkalihalobacillus sp. LMS6]|uniref:protein kinase domain-containing protein n=1 Tax=Alkalihalobacillus sp. LMS6 TaxID=2924034 RepID=UPI0020D156F0|nr:protein kinase [Alkalihalobacillus sp. LMS6]UTR06570.1 protein kinase [Alkalihalobacillus sp. LMS6]
MNNFSAKENEVSPGLTVVGKWNARSYTLIRQLGEGVTGVVYLAQSIDGKVAIKFGLDQMSIAQEVNVLKELSKVQEIRLGPYLHDVDDYQATPMSRAIPYYVMEYIQGVDFLRFMSGKGSEWLSVVIIQLLTQLQQLHERDWIFGDLKPENIIVTKYASQVRLLDVGGTTKKNRAIKEYTELYDRGYWVGGSRKAEVSYDLFSVAILMIHCAYPNQLKKESHKPLEQLKKQIERSEQLKPFKSIILGALQGQYQSAENMKNELLLLKSTKKTSYSSAEINTSRMTRIKKQRQKHAITDLIFLIAFVGLLIILYLLVSKF